MSLTAAILSTPAAIFSTPSPAALIPSPANLIAAPVPSNNPASTPAPNITVGLANPDNNA